MPCGHGEPLLVRASGERYSQCAAQRRQPLGVVGVGGFQQDFGVARRERARSGEQRRDAVSGREAVDALAAINDLAREHEGIEVETPVQGVDLLRARGPQHDQGACVCIFAGGFDAERLRTPAQLARAFGFKAGATVGEETDRAGDRVIQ